MKHSISIYDTGRINSYTHRHEGWAFANIMAGIVLGVVGVIFVCAGLFDPTVTSVVPIYAGIVSLLVPAVSAMLFLTHRNFGLDAQATETMDAIYTLPKKERKKYNIGRGDVSALSSRESDDLIAEIATYRRNVASSGGKGALSLSSALKDYNETVRSIES